MLHLLHTLSYARHASLITYASQLVLIMESYVVPGSCGKNGWKLDGIYKEFELE
jgi:hypothetical protein